MFAFPRAAANDWASRGKAQRGMSLDPFRMAYRAYRNTAFHGIASNGYEQSSKTRSPQAVIGGAGLAAVVLACAWTLYANVAGPGVRQIAVDLPPVSFIPSASAALHTTPAPLDVDVTASLGTPSATFSERFLARLDDARPALAKADRLQVRLQVASLQPQAEATLAAPPAAQDQAQVAQIATALPLPEIRQPALSVPLPAPRPAALASKIDQGPSRRDVAQANKAAILAAIAVPQPTIFEKLFGKPGNGPSLAFASPDGGISSDGQSLTPGQMPLYDKQTAVYDISAKTVYLPSGKKLEAHSGLGSKMDDPRFVHVRMHGATPPHVYDLTPRESLFHGVQALRLHPVGGKENIHGRTGLLAHSYLLGPNGDSNGCVSFKDYDAFLRAYQNNEIKRLVVVAKLS